MAVYVFSAKVIGRKQGRSIVAAAAYRSASRLTDAAGNVHDYTRKEGVALTEILAPDDAPAWVKDRGRLWLTVEQTEKRKDAQLARELLLALPARLELADQTALLRSFLRAEFVRRGMVADVAIHLDNPTNPHAHVLLTMRELKPDGFGLKRRDWNAAFTTHHAAGRFTSGTDALQGWRMAWERHINHALALAGRADRVDHRTLKAQRAEALARGDLVHAASLDREPQPKRGVSGHQHGRNGSVTPALQRWAGVEQRNALRRQRAASDAREAVPIAVQLAELEEALQRPRGPIPERSLAR